MVARRVRIIAGTTMSISLLGICSATPAAAAECALTAPTYVNVGTVLTVAGSGFPTSSAVDITITIAGGTPDEFTVQSDATGAFQIVSTPEDLDIGVTTARAAAGSACTAQVTYTVLAAGATAPPPSPGPTDQAGTGATPGAPRTDTEGVEGVHLSGTWALALVLIAVGGAGLLMTRSPRRR